MDKATTIALELSNVSRKIRQKEILSPLSYTLEKGKTLALCGGNGAGKSTLIRSIIGLNRPTTGSVKMFGFHQKKDERDFKEQFGYMPDDFEFQPMMTAKETISFYAKLKKIPTEQWMATIKKVGLADKLNEKVGTFSKGMRQRLLLAQSLMSQPEIVILDEPTNGLDPYWIEQFSALILEIKAQGRTVIFSTHDLHVAEKVAEDVLFLKEGQVIEQGAVDDFREKGLYHTFQEIYFRTLKEE